MAAYTPKTGARCYCRRGIERDNCANCEGTGYAIDFRAIHARRLAAQSGGAMPRTCHDLLPGDGFGGAK